MTLVQTFTKDAEKRLKELQPAVEEANEIREALAKLSPTDSTPESPKPRQRRKRKGGNRADEFVTLVQKNPGIKVSAAAEQMGIPPNYLYRVAAALVEQGTISKEGKGYSVSA